MKKVLVLLLALTLIVSLCACGANKVVDVNPTISSDGAAALRADFENAKAFVEANIDMKNMEAQDQDQEDPSYLYQYWFAQDAPNVEFSLDAELDGQTVTVGKTTVKELKELGFELSTDQKVIEPDVSTGLSLSKGDKICNITLANNDTGKELPIDEGVLSEVDMIGNEFGISYVYSGLKDQSSFKDVIDKLGAPNSQVKISSDDSGVSIELSYFNSTQDGDKTSDKSLTVYFGYDTTNNTATVRQINLAITQS